MDHPKFFVSNLEERIYYSRTCRREAATQKEDQNFVFKTDYFLMQVKSITFDLH